MLAISAKKLVKPKIQFDHTYPNERHQSDITKIAQSDDKRFLCSHYAETNHFLHFVRKVAPVHLKPRTTDFLALNRYLIG